MYVSILFTDHCYFNKFILSYYYNSVKRCFITILQILAGERLPQINVNLTY